MRKHLKIAIFFGFMFLDINAADDQILEKLSRCRTNLAINAADIDKQLLIRTSSSVEEMLNKATKAYSLSPTGLIPYISRVNLPGAVSLFSMPILDNIFPESSFLLSIFQTVVVFGIGTCIYKGFESMALSEQRRLAANCKLLIREELNRRRQLNLN